MSRAKVRSERRSNRIGVISVSVIVMAVCGVLLVQMNELKEKDAKLQKQEEAVAQKLEEEKDRTDKLEEKRIYVQTKKYVEEVAKKLGYVYPDEILFKPYEN